MNDAIAEYASGLDPARAAICNALQAQIDANLPQATSKLWHAIPVWLIGQNAVVGYTARKEGVVLMFWNGQAFAEPELKPSGSFHVAQIRYDDVSQIDATRLAVWLAKAATNIWDMVGERNAFIAARRAAKKKAPAKSARPSRKAKPKPAAKRAQGKAKVGRRPKAAAGRRKSPARKK